MRDDAFVYAWELRTVKTLGTVKSKKRKQSHGLAIFLIYVGTWAGDACSSILISDFAVLSRVNKNG